VMQFIIADTLKPQFKSVSNAMTHTKQVIAHTKHKGDVARIVPFSVGMHFFRGAWRCVNSALLNLLLRPWHLLREPCHGALLR
jgi:hypothetical protein